MSAGSIVCASAGGLRPVVIELDSIPERTCPSPQPDVAATTAVPRREGGEGRRIRHGVVTVPRTRREAWPISCFGGKAYLWERMLELTRKGVPLFAHFCQRSRLAPPPKKLASAA